MKFALATAVLASAATLTVAQSSIPTCFTTCYQQALASSGTTCGATELSCLCADGAFQVATIQCLQTTCASAAEITAAEAVGVQTCQTAGVSIDTAAVGSSVAAAGGSTASGAGSTTLASSASSAASSAASSIASAASGASGASSGASSKASSAVSGASSLASSATGVIGSLTSSAGAAATSAPASAGNNLVASMSLLLGAGLTAILAF